MKRARIGVGVLVALTVLLSGQTALAQAPGPRASVTGTFTMVFGDPQERASQARHDFFLTDGNGTEHRLEVSDAVGARSGGVTNLTGKRVTVTGAVKPSPTGGPSVIEATGIDVVDGPAATPQALSGPQRFATILCRFSDSTGVTPQTVPYMEGLLGDAYPGISHFWRENSYDLINNVGSIVSGWHNLPQPRSYYVPGGNLDFGRAAADCTALADPTVDFNNFVGINLVFNQVLDCCAWGGSWIITLDGTNKAWPMTWMPPWGVADQSVLGHEMGHAYGLPHSSGDYGAVYDSYWDVMSWGGRALGTPDATYGRLGTQTIGYHKDRLAWIAAGRKYTPAAGSCQVVTIDRLAQVPATAGTYLMAQIPTTTDRFYTVEARKNEGYDSGRIPAEAIVIHDVLATRAEPAHLMDATLNGNPNDAGAAWLPGETFTDIVNGVSIEVVAATADGWSVRIGKDNGCGVITPPRSYVARASSGASIIPGTTSIGNACDDCVTAVSLPFPFTFYGKSQTSVNVSSNGTLDFSGSSATYTNSCLPTPEFGSVIAPYWDDQRTDAPGSGIFTATTGVAPDRQFVIEYRSTLFDGGTPLSYEVILAEGSPTITTIYGPGPTGTSATVGIQLGSSGPSTQLSCGTVSVAAGTRVDYILSPVPSADFDGNRATDKAVFRPSTGQWFVKGGSPEVTQYGATDDIPVPGDYDGNGTTDKAVYRPTTGQWFVRGGSPEVTQYGAADDIPVPGDFDGNGSVDKAVFRPSTGQWFVRGGSPEVTQYGVSGDQPQPGDYDGNATTDKAVYRSTTGQWFVLGGSPEVTQYGATDDVALVLPHAVRRVFLP